MARSLKPSPPPRAVAEPRVAPISSHPGDAARYAFFVNWDDNSFVSLKRNATGLDVLAPEWMHLAGADGAIRADDPIKEARVRAWLAAHAPRLAITPLVNNYDSATQSWDGRSVARLAADPAARARFVAAVTASVATTRDRGVHLDFEQVPEAAMPDYARLIDELGAALHTQGRTLDVSVPVDDESIPFARLARSADHLVLMAYDEHTTDADPGPLASQGWFERTLDRRFAALPDGKLIVAIGSYAYDWRGSGHGVELTMQEAWQAARDSDSRVAFDAEALAPTFAYLDDSGRRHEVWALDAATAYNQTAAALAMKPAGVALWRLGSEDPGVWSFFARGRHPDAAALAGMRDMHAGYDLVYDGDGEALRVTGAEEPGARRFTQDPADGLILSEAIDRLPEATTLTRWGATRDKTVALTFDDGPDPEWTPAVLDALKAAQAPATFFLIGGNAVAHPELVRRIVAEGHDIGSHSFTHPNISELPDALAEVELNTTERALESITGLRPLLFRPPYAEDIEPETIDDTRIVDLASRLGYTTLGLRVDPGDWRSPGVDTIVDETVRQVEQGEGHVVLLHDSGGDRSQTIAAIPQIVRKLRADGYRFVTAHDLLGLPRDAVMPTAPLASPAVVLERSAFWAVSDAEALVTATFLTGLALGLLRFAIIALLAVAQVMRRRRSARAIGRAALPSLSVIVPAYNEEKVVVETVRSILHSDRARLMAGFEVIVVDDGSKDGTLDAARSAFAGDHAVRVMTKPNGGKASAINFGVAQARGEIVVVIDADTILEPAALERLAAHFADTRVGAVAGNAKVGNRVNLLTRFQALEYITSQNLDRRAFETVQAISVVPGAIGAWRAKALREIGGFATDTLAEDADATIELQRRGWRVEYEPRAIARTEAPETMRAFLKQRLRWMFGTLQAAYKHRAALTTPGARRLGWTLLPNVLVFQVVFPLISPVMDGLLAASLFGAAVSLAMHPGGALPSGFGQALAFYALFQLVELAGGALSFAFDTGEDWRLLPLVIVQRFCYRQLLYFTAVRALLAAARGGVMEWGKLARMARLKAAAMPTPGLAE
ncbi:MAG: glycosyltransferase [Alphaproteobacteria bacterium]|nr:glycosyltransferase [Alphaproteobacteria bacterium]